MQILFVVVKTSDLFCAEINRGADISRDEPDFAIAIDGTDREIFKRKGCYGRSNRMIRHDMSPVTSFITLPFLSPNRAGKNSQVGEPCHWKRQSRRIPTSSAHKRRHTDKKRPLEQRLSASDTQVAKPGTVFFRCRISMPCLCSPCQMGTS